MMDCFSFLSWGFSRTKPDPTTSRYNDDLYTKLLDVEITENSSRSNDDDLFSKLPKKIMTTYILNKLPAKDLFQFMQVSKLFKSLISQPDFLNLHISSLHPTQNYLIFHKYLPCKRFYICYQSDANDSFSSYKPVEIPFESRSFSGSMKVVGSTRGVVFFWYRDYISSESAAEHLFLWNPLIEKLKRVPPAPPIQTPIQLVFGFGFDQVTVDFKVVKIVYHDWDRTDRAEAFVYAQKTKVWRSIGNVVPCVADLSNYDSCNSVTMNGVVYWLAYKHPLGCYTIRRPDCIMGFNVVEEAFEVVKLPHCILKHAKESRLSTWLDGESLAVFVRKDIQGSYSTWSMFVMNVVCDTKGTLLSWEKKISLVMSSRYFVPQRLVNSRQVMVTVMTTSRTKKLVLIDIKDEEMRDVGDRRLPPFTYITDYTPSLALLDS